MTEGTALLALARVLLDDAREVARDSHIPAVQTDLAVGLWEWERVTGEDVAAADQFAQAWELALTEHPPRPWLYGGVAELGWLAHRLSARGMIDPVRTDALDQYILGTISTYPPDQDIDVVRGVVGLGVYGLAHTDPAMRELISGAVLDVVDSRIEWEGDGCFVRASDPIRDVIGTPVRTGDRDLGTAHGNAGLAAYLGMAAAAGPDRERAQRMLTPLLRWLVRQARWDGPGAFWAAAERRGGGGAGAWCYGDPGVAMALHTAAGGLPRDTLRENVDKCAARVAKGVLARATERAGVRDCCLCHGAAGLGYFGGRCGELFGLDGGSYASEWRQYIESARADGPLWYFDDHGKHRNSGFLQGDVGVMLSLLYAVHPEGTLWDELLLARAAA
jgi:hypothetical protein